MEFDLDTDSKCIYCYENVILIIKKDFISLKIDDFNESYRFIIKDNEYHYQIPQKIRDINMEETHGFVNNCKSNYPHPPHYENYYKNKVCNGVPGVYIFELPKKIGNLKPGKYALEIPECKLKKYIVKIPKECTPKLYKIKE